MDVMTIAGATLGGLGLFLLAISMMTDGLKLAAGSALRTLLSRWCQTPLRGIFSGFFMTALVQSSSAVTVASLGFVNAGILTMRQSLGVIYGANIGTTMTGWLVAILGFKLHIQAFALPMVGIGMVMKLVKPNHRLGAFGLALVGFGLFFIGIDVLKTTFEGMVTAFDITQFTAEGVKGVVIFLGIGILMTILMQSSSASIALTIAAASSGIVGLYAAGAMVIGANIGTSSTALLASIGATANAKRVAAAQVIFNVLTAIVALIILPILFVVIEYLSELLQLKHDAAIALALFHTLFNVLGVLLIYPQNDRLARYLESKFNAKAQQADASKFLDHTVAQTPALAINALLLELLSIADKMLTSYTQLLTAKNSDIALKQTIEQIKQRSSDVSQFIINIERSALEQEVTTSLATLMRVEHYLLTSTLLLEQLAQSLNKLTQVAEPQTVQQVTQYALAVQSFMDHCRDNQLGSLEQLGEQVGQLQSAHDQLKDQLILQCTTEKISVEQMTLALDCIAEILQITQQWQKAFMRIISTQQALNPSSMLDDAN